MIDYAEMRQQAPQARRTTPYVHYVWNGIHDPAVLTAAALNFPDTAGMIQKPGVPRWASSDRTLLKPEVARVCEELLADDTIRCLSDITGTLLRCDRDGAWGSFRASTDGSWHQAHVGDNIHAEKGWPRRWSLFTYLNHDWDTSYGARLELWRKDADTPDVTIDPLFGRSVLIETTALALHGVSRMMAPPTAIRRTVTVHYWGRERP